MKKNMFLVSFALIVCFLVSCTTDNEEEKVIQQSEVFTLSEIEEIKSFKNFSESSKNAMQPIVREAIKRNRAKTRGMDEYSSEELDAIRLNLKNIGKETLSLFEDMGADMSELYEICPHDNLELYGMIGLEISDALDPSDIKLFDGGDGCEIAIKFNKDKAINCLMKVFGLNDLWPAVYKVGAGFAAGYTTKRVLLSTVKTIVKEAVAKGALVASGGAITIALFVAEWATCYFDVPFFSMLDVFRPEEFDLKLYPSLT